MNGDGLIDRIAEKSALLGDGYRFTTNRSIRLDLPVYITAQDSGRLDECAPPGTLNTTTHRGTLRDVTGDGIPDLVTRDADGVLHGQLAVYIGTGAGFPNEPVAIDGSFSISEEKEACDGSISYTKSGLFDMDGDGNPDVVYMNTTTGVITIWKLVAGGRPGAPEAGRITSSSNGAGAVTSISYRSAKDDGTTLHQVPSPEIVVDRVETNGTTGTGLGGSLAARTYAYGNNSVFFDPMLDAFRPTGYLRSVEVAVTATPGGPEELTGSAILTDRYPLNDIAFPGFPDGGERYVRVGRVSDVHSLVVPGTTDPWSLLTVATASDARRRAGTHISSASHLDFTTSSVSDCYDLLWPYDSSLSLAFNQNHEWFPCTAHGYAYSDETTSWRGSAAPPSSSNVQTRTVAGNVDQRGRPQFVRYYNDIARSDDDVCVDIVYAAPVSTSAPTRSAVATRTVYGCTESDDGVVYASDMFEYDNLPLGSVATGLLTSHSVHRHATDNGADLGTVREFDAYYDAAGNPILITRTREDGAQQVTSMDYDEFHLAPSSISVSGTNLPTLSSSYRFDWATMQIAEATGPNGTTAGTTFDGFGRPTTRWITEPETSQQAETTGVLTAISYLDFDGSSPLGRRVEVKKFSDPVEDPTKSEGRVSTTYLDELGRPRFTSVSLGEDYEDASMIVGKRTYDGLGRVWFQADPFTSTQDPATAYGSTLFFAQDGSLAATIRGRGPQGYTDAVDDSVERYPTLFSRSYSGSQAVSSVRTADALIPSSPQYGVSRVNISSAIGRDLSRSTWSGSVRLEYATFSHDHLGNLTGMTRYQDPANALNPVSSTRRMDSQSRVIELTEPSSAPQSRTYSNWGDLLKIEWTPPAPELKHSVNYSYDALGRLLHAEERNDGVTDPETIFTYEYDYSRYSPLADNNFTLGRLAYANTSQGTEYLFGYDALGNVNAQTYIDTDDTPYSEQSTFHADQSIASITLALPDNGYDGERVDYAYDTAARLRWMWYSDSSDFKELFSASDIDAWGRLRSATFGDASYEALFTDVGRRLPIASEVLTAAQIRKFNFNAFDALGRTTSRSLDLANVNALETTTYDALGRLSHQDRHQGTATLSQWSYSYDALGNVLNLNDQVGTDDATLSYLASGDRDRICRVGYGNGGLGGTMCNVYYDSFGNVASQPTRTGKTSLEFFNAGSVRKIDRDGVEANFNYDPFGGVQSIAIEESTPQGTMALRTDRNLGSLITKRWQFGPAGSVDYVGRRFPGAGFSISRRGPPGAPWLTHYGNSQGIQFTTYLSGGFAQDNDYSPFGEGTTTGAQPGLLEYSTESWNDGDALDALGLVHVGARIYDPVTGRFLSRDPLLIPRTASTTNPFAFAFNDPMNLSDRTGLSPCLGGACGIELDYLDAVSTVATLGGLLVGYLGQNATSSSPSHTWTGAIGGAMAGLSTQYLSIPAGRFAADMAPWTRKSLDRDETGNGPPPVNPFVWIFAAPDDPDSGMPPFHMMFHLALTAGPLVAADMEMAAVEVALFDDVAEELLPRGIKSEWGGEIFAETNEAGGTVWTAEGTVAHNDFTGIVTNAISYGEGRPVNVITGAHGYADGTIKADATMLLVDTRNWGRIGANILDISNPSHAAAIKTALGGPGTTVGAFCNSAICLKLLP